ncbi:MAG: hypothetical protein GDA37_13305 [Ekhidna sp.]|nr:hypothetical protein [Ekhidna sp.]
MEFKQIQTEMRELDKEVGKNTSEAILKLMDLKAQTFEQKLDILSNQVNMQINQMNEKIDQTNVQMNQINTQMNAQNNSIKILGTVIGLVSILASIAGQFIN